MPNTYQGVPPESTRTQDRWVEIARLAFNSQSAGIIVAGGVLSMAIYSIGVPLAQLPIAVNNMTLQMQRVESAFSEHAALLESINKRVTQYEEKERKG